MLIRKVLTMLTLMTDSPNRLRSNAAPARPDDDWVREDSSRYDSSFDLARGLDVIEHRGAPDAIFSDTLPAYRWPRA